MTIPQIREALTFDDVLLVPDESDVTPKDVDVATVLIKDFPLHMPILSSAMDTVTESRMAIEMAHNGGLGIIHKNFTIEDQVAEVRKVKRAETGIIKEPYFLENTATISDYHENVAKNNVKTFPIIDKKTQKIIGIVSKADVRFAEHQEQLLIEVMTPRKDLITVLRPIDRENIQDTMRKTRMSKVVIIDDQDHLDGMVTADDFHKISAYPNSLRDERNRLVCGGAVGTGENELARAIALLDAEVDIIVVDTAHGHSKNVGLMVRKIKDQRPNARIIAGNVATGKAAKFLIDSGADAIKVGIGPGSICTTRIISGVGVPQLTAVMDVVEVCKPLGIPVIADGGIKQSGDIAKAIAAGADCVMIGSMLAGTDEAPGSIILLGGRSFKSYRGMGSLSAMAKGSADRYFQGENQHIKEKLVPEGVEGRVPYKGTVNTILHQLVGGLRSAMGYTGSPTIGDLQGKTFVKITNAGLHESHVHDITISREAPNYTTLKS